MALVVSVELATWNAVDVESSPAIVKTDESKECHVPAHCEARGVSSNKQRSSMSDLADPCNCPLAVRIGGLRGAMGPRIQARVPLGPLNVPLFTSRP